MHHFHHVIVVEGDIGAAAADPRVAFEIDRQRRSAPWQREHRLHEIGNDHLDTGPGCVRHQLFFPQVTRSEEHTSELQSLMRIHYAVLCLNKTTVTTTT